MRRPRRDWLPICCGLALLVLLLAGASEVLAQSRTTDPQRLAMTSRGKVAFDRYCNNCHGEEGRGEGPVAEWLKIPPTNLRRLSAENDGTFPEERVMRSIDGRDPVRGHGMREMPVWGEVLAEPEGGADQAPEVTSKIRDLVEFLRTVQEE